MTTSDSAQIHKKMWRIVIADDEPSSLDQLSFLIRSFQVNSGDDCKVRAVLSAANALKECLENEADVVFLDQEFSSGASGDEVIDAMLKSTKVGMIVLLSHLDSDELGPILTRCRQRWSDRICFQSKPLTAVEVYDIFQRAEQYRIAFSDANGILVRTGQREIEWNGLTLKQSRKELTPRQWELWMILSKGRRGIWKEITAIANELDVDVGTVQRHVSDLREKLSERFGDVSHWIQTGDKRYRFSPELSCRIAEE